MNFKRVFNAVFVALFCHEPVVCVIAKDVEAATPYQPDDADLGRSNQKLLRENKRLGAAASEAMDERDALEAENQELKKQLRDAVRGSSKEKDPTDKTPSWWKLGALPKWMGGGSEEGPRKGEDAPEVVEGCHSLKCCAMMAFNFFGAATEAFLTFVVTFFGDPIGYCSNSLQGWKESATSHINLLSNILGVLLAWGLVNLLSYVYLEMKLVWNKTKAWFLFFFRMPALVVLGQLLSGVLKLFTLQARLPEANPSEIKELKKRIEDLTKLVESRVLGPSSSTQTMANNATQPHSTMAPTQAPMAVHPANRPRNHQGPPIVCAKCKQVGHRTSECKMPNPPLPPRPCFRCGKAHWEDLCPLRKQDRRINALDANPSPEGGFEPAEDPRPQPTSSAMAGTEPSAIIGSICANMGNKMTIPCKLENLETDILCDTGATVNAISMTFLEAANKTEEVKKSDGKVVAFDGKPTPFVGIVELELTLGDTATKKLPFVVFQELPSIILGTNGLKAFKASVDTQNDVVRTKHHVINCSSKN